MKTTLASGVVYSYGRKDLFCRPNVRSESLKCPTQKNCRLNICRPFHSQQSLCLESLWELAGHTDTVARLMEKDEGGKEGNNAGFVYLWLRAGWTPC